MASTVYETEISYGEDHLTMMFELYFEMAAFKTISNLLYSSGLIGALVQANVAATGTADSFLRVT